MRSQLISTGPVSSLSSKSTFLSFKPMSIPRPESGSEATRLSRPDAFDVRCRILGWLVAGLVALALLTVSSDVVLSGRRVEPRVAFQNLVRGLGFGSSPDCSYCRCSFDPRLDQECVSLRFPIPGGAHLCPKHFGAVQDASQGRSGLCSSVVAVGPVSRRQTQVPAP